jgi:hypothetical protein
MSANGMKAKRTHELAEMRAEYNFDYSKAERGRYYKRLLKEGSNVVVLDRDVAKRFTDSASVNKALRSMIKSKRSRRPTHGQPEARAPVSHVCTVKEELLELPRHLPHDSSAEDIVGALLFHVMVQRGLADSDAGRSLSNGEMGRRMRSFGK